MTLDKLKSQKDFWEKWFSANFLLVFSMWTCSTLESIWAFVGILVLGAVALFIGWKYHDVSTKYFAALGKFNKERRLLSFWSRTRDDDG